MSINTKQPLVSVIMNCYNGEKYLREAIDSVYVQTYQNWEIIFWDNASMDSSGKIAQSYDEKLKYYRAEKNTPLGEARGLALAKSNGVYISFLDCDDAIYSDKLNLQVKSLEKTDAMLSYGSSIVINGKGKKIRNGTVPDFYGYAIEKLLYRYDINMQTVMVKRDVFLHHHIFLDKNLTYSPDYNLFMKIASIYPIASTKKCLAKYRVHDNSLSSEKLKEVSIDGKHTLDYIFSNFEAKIGCYGKAKSAAYNKLNFYDAIYHISNYDYSSAKKSIRPVIFKSVYYFLLYTLLFLNIERCSLLKLLRR